ncbi:hypothetical protein BGZ49_002587 [Haplosporangium sp. Z 27]|nr:hypothetical protein BGZ49_002587 [Haplosporangium sp. Z 27]
MDTTATATPATLSSSPAEEAKTSLERSLELLRPGSSDEAKFIGLTIMSELLQTTQDLKTMTQFFDNMDFEFLDRMMQIEENSVPEDAGVDATAINDQTDNSKKILKILIRISAYPQVSMVLTNAKYQSTIITYILDTFDRKDEAHDDAILICKRTFLIIQEGYKQNPQIVLKITKDFLPAIMSKLSKSFCALTEAYKPQILRLMTDSVAYLPEAYVQQHAKEYPRETKIWTRNLKSGLIQLLSTRQAPATRDDSFKLIGFLLQRLGPEWIFPQLSLTSTTKNTEVSSKKKSSPASLVSSMEILSLSDADVDKKFASLVVHLTCVEVRVLMDQLADDLTPPSARLNKGVFTTEDEANQEKTRKEQVLPLTFEILEVSIGYLVHVSEGEDSLDNGLFDATGLLKVQESLQGAFTAILDYLKDLQTDICFRDHYQSFAWTGDGTIRIWEFLKGQEIQTFGLREALGMPPAEADAEEDVTVFSFAICERKNHIAVVIEKESRLLIIQWNEDVAKVELLKTIELGGKPLSAEYDLSGNLWTSVVPEEGVNNLVTVYDNEYIQQEDLAKYINTFGSKTVEVIPDLFNTEELRKHTTDWRELKKAREEKEAARLAGDPDAPLSKKRRKNKNSRKIPESSTQASASKPSEEA